MLVRLSTLWFGFCLLWSFNLSFYKLPEEVSRKHGSRNRRLARTDVCNDARPDVSQQTSRKDRRTYFLLRSTGKHRGLATDVSQRLKERRPYFYSLVHLLSLWFGYCTSFCPLPFLSAS